MFLSSSNPNPKCYFFSLCYLPLFPSISGIFSNNFSSLLVSMPAPGPFWEHPPPSNQCNLPQVVSRHVSPFLQSFNITQDLGNQMVYWKLHHNDLQNWWRSAAGSALLKPGQVVLVQPHCRVILAPWVLRPGLHPASALFFRLPSSRPPLRTYHSAVSFFSSADPLISLGLGRAEFCLESPFHPSRECSVHGSSLPWSQACRSSLTRWGAVPAAWVILVPPAHLWAVLKHLPLILL